MKTASNTKLRSYKPDYKFKPTLGVWGAVGFRAQALGRVFCLFIGISTAIPSSMPSVFLFTPGLVADDVVDQSRRCMHANMQ